MILKLLLWLFYWFSPKIRLGQAQPCCGRAKTCSEQTTKFHLSVTSLKEPLRPACVLSTLGT